MKVLFIADDADIIVKISVLFKLYVPGEKLYFSILGKDGIIELKRETYNLLLLNLSMPDISGEEIVKRVREFSDIPIIAISPSFDQAEKSQILHAGADYYLAQPIQYSDLLVIIRSLLYDRNFAINAMVKKNTLGKFDNLSEGVLMTDSKTICLRLN